MTTEATPGALGSNEGLGPPLEKAMVDFGVACKFGDTAARQATAEAIREAARAAVAAQRERCIAAMEAVPPHRWVDGSDQWGNPCPAKIVATRAEYVAAIRRA